MDPMINLSHKHSYLVCAEGVVWLCGSVGVSETVGHVLWLPSVIFEMVQHLLWSVHVVPMIKRK